MVTAEIAVATPVLMLLLGAMLAVLAVIAGQLRCIDAAREAARALARGDSVAQARALVAAVGPHDARLSTSSGPTRIRATVRARIHTGGGLLPAFTVSAAAVAMPEPTGAGP